MEILHLPLDHAVPVYAVLALVAIVIPILSDKLRIPSIVGLILAGVVLGESVTNVIGQSAAVDLPATLGLLYIMFLAGLEIDLNQVAKRLNHSLIFGLTTFLVPFGSGIAIGLFILKLSTPGAFLLGAMFASHTLLTLPIVSRYGLAKTPVVTTVIGGTIITDILALMVLAFVAGQSQGSLDATFFIKFGIFAVVAFLLIRWIVPNLGRWFFSKVASDSNIEYAFVLVILFAVSFGAEVAGLEGIIGAILAGIALNRLIPENSALMNRVKFVGESLFIPVFLISVGLIIDLEQLISNPQSWVVAGVMVAGAALTKFLASVFSSAILKQTPPERTLMFGMSINRASATLAAVLVGYNLQIFPEEIVAGTVLTILVTCVLGPILTQAAAQKLALRSESEAGVLAPQPQRILLTVTNEGVGQRLVDFALLLRDHSSHEPIHPLHVVEPGENPEESVARAEKILTGAVVRASSAGVPVVPLSRIDTSLQDGILRAMLDQRISILVTDWNGESTIYGSTYGRAIEEVLENSRQTVYVTHFPSALPANSRIVFVIPPLAHVLGGLSVSMHGVKTLASQLGSKIQLLVHRENRDEVEEIYEAVKPEVATTVQDYANYAHVHEDMEKLPIKESDVLILLSVRIGHLAWQPRMDKLPVNFLRRHKKNNLAVVFPPLPTAAPEAEAASMTSGAPNKLFGPANTVTIPARRPLHNVIRTVLKEVFHLPPALQDDFGQILFDIARNEAVELREGVVLLHAHVDFIEHNLIGMAVSENLFDIPRVTDPKRLIILLGPRLQSAEAHIKMLSAIAKEVRSMDLGA